MATTTNIPFAMTADGMFLEDLITCVLRELAGKDIKDIGFEIKLKGGHTIDFVIKVKKGKK